MANAGPINFNPMISIAMAWRGAQIIYDMNNVVSMNRSTSLLTRFIICPDGMASVPPMELSLCNKYIIIVN